MIPDHRYIETAWSRDRYTLYGYQKGTTLEEAIRTTERAREVKGLKARRFKERLDGEDVYVIYVLRQG